MKPKWTIVSVIVLTLATAGSIWGIKIYYDEQAYNKQMSIARNAVAGHEWEIARTAYQKSRKIHVSVENRTASQQLTYLENADNEIKQHNWESAVNMYNQVLMMVVLNCLIRLLPQVKHTLTLSVILVRPNKKFNS
ncbi:hypothetical protein [Weissella confusa]|uniref:hypothetical protein n=1 Tax=Weissella confusa TaxID=1583 RepID=UPI00223BD5E3|nr:hypothetical protein [Weissella confusa]